MRERRSGSEKGPRGNLNLAVPADNDPLPGGHEPSTPVRFAVLYQNKHDDLHVDHAGWPAADFAAVNKKKRNPLGLLLLLYEDFWHVNH